MRKVLLFVATLSAGGVAQAEPASARLDRLELGASAGVQLQHRPTRKTLGAGWVAFHAVARTARIESVPIAGTGDAVAEAAATPHFSRNEGDIVRGAGWTIELDASLRRQSWAGNALFKFIDTGDKAGNAEGDYTAAYQTQIPRTKELAGQATLTLEDGFQPGHTYKLVVSQLIRSQEIVLAEASFTLE